MTPVAFAYRDDHFLCFYQIACGIQVCDPLLPAFISVHTCVFTCQVVHCSIQVYAGKYFQVMSLSDFKIVRVVSRRDLNCSGSLLRIRIRVSYNRYFLAD